MKPRKVVIQQTQGVTLRVTVEVFRCELTRGWVVRWLDQEHAACNRPDALARAREFCGSMLELGITSELIILRVNGTIGERRTYGDDPKESKG